MSRKHHIPTYSLHNFSSSEKENRHFQLEVFDANRHFQVEYPHRHDFYEVLFLSKGSGYHVIDSNRYVIKPPCIFFMSPGQAHKLELSNDIEGYIFIFTAEFYLLNQSNQNRLLEFPFFFTIKQNNPPLQLSKDDFMFIEQLFLKGIAEVNKPEGFVPELLRSILDLILVNCSTQYNYKDELVQKGKGQILVKRFYQLVEENYINNLSINDYAEMLNITPNHLTQTVKQLTGKTSNQIIQAKQLLEIKRLLIHTSMSVTEIADQMHFSDQSYFTKFFKKQTNLTPLQYRNKSLE